MVGIDNRRPALSKLALVVLVMVLVLSVGAVPARAAATTFTVTYSEETELFVYVPCALGGMGEEVYLSGPLHILFSVTYGSSGSFVSKYLFQPQGISGTGVSSGDKYQATGETGETYTGRIGYQDTFVNNFKIVGQGPGNNFMVHENLHITVNPNGTLTAYADNFSVDCKPSSSYP
jgi:hypothetical protein